ncbi:beta-galactosidase [Paenibacillus sp. CCS19]|uniref:GH35 family beta-galactosidase n=1 Tax=Paenibacillus sp. CCS19 TaxID=3158387 RepID=UPI002564A58C|nr:DUF5597 domain-containing protein [Paenibacillus cellulosilyticus]GMK39135.1 beta-galactosidase [Paenibacillus cellulosilyticus]
MNHVIQEHGRPFIMLAGEVNNSSSSSIEYMEPIWHKAAKLGMNSLLLPVTWEMIEPEEGVFEFQLVDDLISQARLRGMKLGFLWFGAWKNAQCYYAPSWVKTDLDRFSRAEVEKGRRKTTLKEFHGMPYTTLSYLCEETNAADARAFRAFMLHLKQVDEKEQTVLLVQVENEPGLQGAARENSDAADELFEADVPQAFVDYMRSHTSTMAEDVRQSVENSVKSGSWKTVFGDVAEEVFSAYHIASYINRVAAAGKEVYSLPMMANCWLDKGEKPGKYPSGGPVARMMEVWKYCAPQIDILAPDIYVQNFCEVCDEYVKMDNPLFIPETAAHGYAGPRLVYVIGHYHALGFAPFGFERLGEPFTAMESYLFGVDITDPLLKTPQNQDEYGWYGRTLNSMMPLLTEKYSTSDLQAVIMERPEQDAMLFGDLGFKIMMNSPIIPRKDGVCLVLKQADDEFIIIANGCAIMPFSTNPNKPNVDILVLEEGRYEQGNWVMTRRLNGDEVAIMRYVTPTLLKIKLFSYQ